MRYILVWLLWFFLQPCSYGQQLRMVADTWAPMTGKKLQEGGFSVDLARQIFSQLGYSLKLTFMPWGDIINAMDSGQFDVVPAIWFTSERDRHLHFSDAYQQNRLVFISLNSESFQYQGLQSLKGKTLGLVTSYAYPQALLQAKGVNKLYSKDARENLRMLAGGRVHLTLGNYLVMKYEATLHVLPTHKLFYDTQNPLADVSLHMAVSRKLKNHRQIIMDVNKVLRTFIADGRYQHLLKKHGIN